MKQSVLLALIVGSLCFSVGEGLRLTPFPVSNLLQIEEPNGLSVANDAGDRTRTYGPIDIPSQVQKRSKRQTTDFGSQPQVENSQAAVFVSYPFEDESIQLRSTLFVSPPAGRGPPLP
ncbi:MAG TPA: hypothetical protein VFT48_19485 [Pyrinomonadaceae bacterium]|nr:hypothetical protein [Pyrinomonadaceae bacterium]